MNSESIKKLIPLIPLQDIGLGELFDFPWESTKMCAPLVTDDILLTFCAFFVHWTSLETLSI